MVLASLASIFLPARAAALTFDVNVNTSALVGHPAAPFYLLFATTDGSGLSDGNNTVTVSNFNFSGGSAFGNPSLFGGVTGDLGTTISITDTGNLNFFSEAFSPGQSLAFTVTVTSNQDDGPIPDGFAFYILDSFGRPIPTLSPGSDYFIGLTLTANGGSPLVFASDPSRPPSSGNPILIPAPTVSSDTTPPITIAALTPTPNATGWSNTNVTITLNSTDNELGGSGVQQITYSATGAQIIASMVVPGASASFTITAEGATTITFFGTDNAGNIETAKTQTIQLDKTAPSINCGAPDGLWHASDVSIACTANDVLSGLANPPDTSFSLSTSVPAGTETSNAATSTHSVCDVAGNCATAGPVSGNMVDKRPPSINVSSPAAGSSYLLNQAVNASFTCTDGGSGVATCVGTVTSGSPISTAPVGGKSFTVNATDNVGNVTPAQSVNYSVTYAVCLLYDPTRAVQNGSTIPLKIQLCDANKADASSSNTVVHALSLVQTSTNASEALQASGNANPDNDFRFDPTLGPTGGYIFNLSTQGLTTGSYQLTFTAGADPMPHVLNFQVR